MCNCAMQNKIFPIQKFIRKIFLQSQILFKLFFIDVNFLVFKDIFDKFNQLNLLTADTIFTALTRSIYSSMTLQFVIRFALNLVN